MNKRALLTGKQDFKTIAAEGRSKPLWPAHCIAGTPGADFHPGMNLDGVNLIVHKGKVAAGIRLIRAKDLESE